MNKLPIPEFKQMCQEHDILCLTETKVDKTNQNYIEEELENLGFRTTFNNRAELTRTRSGGILIAYKKEHEKYITEVNTRSDVVKFIQIDKTALGYTHNIALGTVYIPPRTSRYAKNDDFNTIER